MIAQPAVTSNDGNLELLKLIWSWGEVFLKSFLEPLAPFPYFIQSVLLLVWFDLQLYLSPSWVHHQALCHYLNICLSFDWPPSYTLFRRGLLTHIHTKFHKMPQIWAPYRIYFHHPHLPPRHLFSHHRPCLLLTLFSDCHISTLFQSKSPIQGVKTALYDV